MGILGWRTASLLKKAWQLYQQQHWSKAQQCARQVIEQTPQPEAYYLLGLIAEQLAQPLEARTAYEQAIALDPWHAPSHYRLAVVLHDLLQQPAAALTHYQRALEVKPEWVEAHSNLGNAYLDLGDTEAAIACYQKALSLNPDLPTTLYNLGLCLHAQGKLTEATACYEQSLYLEPGQADVHNNLGSAYLELKNYAAAAVQFQAALGANPELLAAHYNLGYALHLQGNLAAARDRYQEVLLRDNKHPQALLQLGQICLTQGDLAAAISYYQRCLSVDPLNSAAQAGLATALLESGDPQAALLHFRQAVALDPQAVEVRLNLALVLLMLGHFREGWQEYEWRWQQSKGGLRSYPQPRWRGQSLAGKTLFVYSEQGLGDCIQFARLLPLLARRAQRVIFAAYPPLMRLCQTLPAIQVISTEDIPPEFDYHSPLLSLPGYLGIDQEHFPKFSPYFQLPAPRPHSMFNVAKPRIGLVWASHSQTCTTAQRSCPLEYFLPLLQELDVQWYSLQKERSPAEGESLRQAGVIDCQPYMGDFLDTALLIQQLDAVVTIDTAVAHLAGALGKPLWILLPFVADWRWFSQGSRSPWYPSAQLIRQPRRGDWPGAIAQLRSALQSHYRTRSNGIPN
ncbi:tetratricopeptide repeat protein [Thermosynechococcus sp. OHK43]|uniref:tetratricopeptide repeat protein n=1 Tax=Thermosynechococcus sp. OHK43 TaxID=2763133 RepID=UPI0025D66987|nr:tetratricopeptide repeat protein [Thermosynechococcus sp. OHK43]